MKEDSFKERLRYEMVGILLAALGIFIFLSLISYSPTDPSFFSYTPAAGKEIHNWTGIVGAYLSGLLFQGFGFPSILIPFLLGLYACSFIFRWQVKYLSLKWAGWTAILLATSSLFGLWLKPIGFFSKDILAGGFLGEVLSKNLVRYFNPPGTTILLLLVLVLSFILGTGLSFISVVQKPGQPVDRSVKLSPPPAEASDD